MNQNRDNQPAVLIRHIWHPDLGDRPSTAVAVPVEGEVSPLALGQWSCEAEALEIVENNLFSVFE